MYQKESFQSKSDDTHDYHIEITTTRKLVSLSIPIPIEDFDEEGNANVLLQNDQLVTPINETHGAIYELPE
mgnify:CR=1 FL=1